MAHTVVNMGWLYGCPGRNNLLASQKFQQTGEMPSSLYFQVYLLNCFTTMKTRLSLMAEILYMGFFYTEQLPQRPFLVKYELLEDWYMQQRQQQLNNRSPTTGSTFPHVNIVVATWSKPEVPPSEGAKVDIQPNSTPPLFKRHLWCSSVVAQPSPQGGWSVGYWGG